MTKTICTSLSLQSVFLYQLQPHSQHEYTIVCVEGLISKSINAQHDQKFSYIVVQKFFNRKHFIDKNSR